MSIVKIAAQFTKQKAVIIDSGGGRIDFLDAPGLLFRQEDNTEIWQTHVPLEINYSDGTKYILSKYDNGRKTAYYKKEGMV